MSFASPIPADVVKMSGVDSDNRKLEAKCEME